MSKRLDSIVEELLSSYQEAGGINHIDQSNLPSKESIAILCEDFMRLLFPGFLDEEALVSNEIEMVTRERVLSIRERLQKEILRSLRSLNITELLFEEVSEDYICKLLEELPKIRNPLSSDVQAAYEGDPAGRSIEEIILAYPSLEAISIQRIAHILYQLKVPLIPRMMTEWAHSRSGIDIHPGAQIGEHFFIDHGTGVVIGETAVIGDRVKLYHGVTLGARSFEKDKDGNPIKGIKRHPEVEDDVVIYSNSTILGGETVIGARSVIGANTVIIRDVAPDTRITGVDALNSDC